MTRTWQTVLGLAVSLLLLYWVLHDVEFADVWRHVRESDIWLLALSVTIQTSGFLIRAARWRVFLTPALAQASFHPLFASTCIGFMVNNLLPARVGEFARAFALSKTQPISASASFGSLVVERLFDGLTLVMFLVVPLFLPGFPVVAGLGDQIVGKIALVLLLFGGVVAAVLTLIIRPGLAGRLFQVTARRLLPRAIADRVGEIGRSFFQGLESIRRPSLVAAGFAWSVAHWLWGALALYIGMLAFGITTPGFAGAAFLQGAQAFFASLPSSPGFFGPFEASVKIVLEPFGVSETQAVSFALAFHIGSFLPVTLIGLYYLGRLGLSFREVGHSEEAVESRA